MSDDRRKSFVPPTPPPLPPGSTSDASQNAPTRAVSLRRLSEDQKDSTSNVRRVSKTSVNGPQVSEAQAGSVRRSSYEQISSRTSRIMDQPSPSSSNARQGQMTSSARNSFQPPSLAPPLTPIPMSSNTSAVSSRQPSPTTSDVTIIQRPPPPPAPLPTKGAKKDPPPPKVAKKDPPPPKAAKKDPPPPKAAKKDPPLPKTVLPKVKPAKDARPQKKARDKMELNANYSILISGTESESDASSIDSDALQKVIELSENETAVFDAVSSGSLLTVKEALDAFQFDYNRRNIVGYTILHIAVRRQDEEMVRLILDEGSKTIWPSVLKDTLLHAIKEVNVNLVRTILAELDRRGLKADETLSNRRLRKDYLDNRKEINEETEFINSEFHEDISPLKLSAMCDSYELVQLFHDRGHDLTEPPVYVPRSGGAKNTNDPGPLRAAYRRLHYFQAISKPSYIAYKANHCSHGKDKDCDPILIAFTLIQEVTQYAEEDVFKTEYLAIADELQEFACNIIQQCRRTEEVEEILGQAEAYNHASPYPRLSMAVDLGLKQFVAHSHCQQILYRYWAGRDWPEWRVKDFWSIFGNVLLRIFLWPVIAIWMCLDRKSKLGKMMACPASSFLNHLVSYFFFMAFILVINVWNPDGPNHRGIPNTGVEYIVIVWVFGFWLSIGHQIVTRGQSYLSNPWAWFDMVKNFLFLLAFLLWFLTPSDPALDRKHWMQGDTTIFAEIVFSIASTMTYVRLLRIFQLSPRIGPLLTAVGQMIQDVLNALLFFLIIICAFALGLARLYRPYQGWSDTDADTKAAISQSEAFSSFPKALESLFWSIFSMGSSGDTTIIPRTIISIHDPTFNSTSHKPWTEHTGKLIYSMYHVVVSLILLNMLLCLMSRTYEVVNANVDAEWKFARSKIWLSYGLDFVNPSPFNFIPPVSACLKNQKKGSEAAQKAAYYKLIKILIQRYFRDKAEIAIHEAATMESIEALQEDIAEFHSLLEKTEAEQYEREKNKATPASAASPLTKTKNPPEVTPIPVMPPTPTQPFSLTRMAKNLAQRYRPPVKDHPTSPSSPNVSSIFGDTSDDTEFETVASYDRRNPQVPIPPPPPPFSPVPSTASTPVRSPPQQFFPIGRSGSTSQPPSMPTQVNLPQLGQFPGRRDSGSRNVHFPPGGTPSPGNSSGKKS